VTITAVFQANTYTVTVDAGTGATGSGEYSPGAEVNITAGTHPGGLPFRKWTVSGNDVTLANAASSTTKFIMPSADVTVFAFFCITFTDSRDSQVYGKVTIGGKAWMAENLNYAASSGSWCYGRDNSYCDKYGRLYDWNTAMTVCPSDWHLPSRVEWGDLAKAAGGTGDYGTGGTAGTKLKSTGWNGTDDYGFSALPGGHYIESSFNAAGIRYYDGSFANDGRGYWWTATASGSDNAYFRFMEAAAIVNEDTKYGVKSYGLSVRCVMND